MFLSFNSFFLFWLFMEINIVLFLLLMWINSKTRFYHLLFYFLIQSFGSLMVLILRMTCVFSTERLVSLIFFIIIFLKMGVFPFYEWVIITSFFLNDKIICLLLRFQKFPLFVLLFNSFNSSLILFFLANLVFGRLMVLSCSRMATMVIFSSIYSTFWFFCSLRVGYIMLLFFMTQYIFLVWSLFQIKPLSQDKGILSIFVGFFLIGIPPFFFFFLKYHSLVHLYSDLGMLSLIALWSGTYLTFMGYIKFFMKRFLQERSFFSPPRKRKVVNVIISMFLFGGLFVL